MNMFLNYETETFLDELNLSRFQFILLPQNQPYTHDQQKNVRATVKTTAIGLLRACLEITHYRTFRKDAHIARLYQKQSFRIDLAIFSQYWSVTPSHPTS